MTRDSKTSRLLEAIIQTTPDLIYVFDLNYRFIYANEALLKMWGRTLEESIGKSLLEIGYEPWHAQMHEREIDLVISTKELIRGEVSFKHATMGCRYYDYIFAPVKDSEGKVKAIAGTTRDITEQVKSREQIKEREEKFRLLVQTLPQLVWVTDDKGNAEFASHRWEEYSGIEPAGEKEWEAIVHPDDFTLISKAWKKCITTGNTFLGDVRIRNKAGEYRWHNVKGKPVLDNHHNIVNWVGAFTDIHEEKSFSKKLEEEVASRTAALKESEEKFISLFNLSPICKTLSEVETGKIIMVNDAFVTTFGFSREEAINKTSEDLGMIDPVAREAIRQEIKLKGNIQNKEIEFIKRSGEKFCGLTSAEIIKLGNNQYFLGAFSDITERKIAEQHIAQKNIELQKLNKELQSFAYISSHDLQEPLRKIQTFASRIEEKEQNNLSETGKDYFRRMQIAAKRMQTLIQDLLAYSRTNTADRKFENTALNTIINEIKEDLQEEINEKKAIIEIEASDYATIIPFQFRQLMYNLISNSLKFAITGQAPYIKIKSRTGSAKQLKNTKLLPQLKYCHISVEDNGIGFEQKYNEKIFEVFQRLHGKNEYTGTGIGLSIVKKIVENHGGIISATSSVNKGTTFNIYFPIA